MLKRKEPPVQVKLPEPSAHPAAQCNVNISTIDKMVERGGRSRRGLAGG